MDDKKMTVGFIGLGIMGQSMARNILKAGFGLTVYNRTAAKAKALADEGAQVAASPAEVARASDIVVSCVTNSQDVLHVLLDATTGVIAGVRDGATVIDCSTVAPSVAQRCSESLSAKGAGFLDAPVSGGDSGARAGTLSIMVGGDAAHLQRAMSVFQAMGKTITHCGGPGAGYVVKLCNQVCVTLNLLAATEALALAKGAGVDPNAMLAAISNGAAGSWQLTNLAPKIVAGDFRPGFFVDYALKDLRLASQACHELNVPLMGAALAESVFRAASAQGHGKEGTQAIYHVIEAMGRKL